MPHSITALRTAYQATQKLMPFTQNAIVVLEDHLHTIWTLPDSDTNYSQCWAYFKKTFSQSYLAFGGTEQTVRDSKQRKRERGVWQRRFWEHTITTEERYSSLMNYIHYNPVKHGYVRCPKDWVFSSFRQCVKQKMYDENWGCLQSGVLEFDVDGLVGE